MKKFFTKIWNWLKSLLKRFQFDNVLFEKGVNEVFEVIKKEVNTIDVLATKHIDKIFRLLNDKFAKYEPIKKYMLVVQTLIEAKQETLTTKTINGTLNKIKAFIIDWYNEKF